MKSGSVPNTWLRLTGSWSARDLLPLLEAVDQRGIAHTDLEAVKRVWDELQTSHS